MCSVGDTRTRVQISTHVYYGNTTPDPSIGMSAGEILALVRYNPSTNSTCSGTVIAPRFVLSAKHCNPSGTSYGTVAMGSDPNNPNVTINVSDVVRSPSNDLMVLRLAEDATVRMPGLVPIRYRTDAVPPSWVGRQVVTGGYGRQPNGALGQRRFTFEPIHQLNGDDLSVNGGGMTGLAPGDSGGTILTRDAGVLFVLGALHGGDASNVDIDTFTRTDTSASWMMGIVAPFTGGTTTTAPPPANPCGTVTAQGECAGSIARWCDSGEGATLRMEACPTGTTCQVDNTVGHVACAAASSSGSGSGSSGAGSGGSGSGSGAGSGSTGGGSSGAADQPGASVNVCGDISAAGECRGEVAFWCDNGVVKSANCGRCSLRCGTVASYGGAYCVGL